MTEEVIQCIFCGNVLSKQAENDDVSYCLNINCPISGIVIWDGRWKTSWAYKELASLKEVSKQHAIDAVNYRKEAEEWKKWADRLEKTLVSGC